MLYFLIIIFRLFNIQITKNEYYSKKYIQQKQNKIIINAPRGRIYDRNYKLLAESPGFAYSFGINLAKVKNKLNLAKRLSNITGQSYKSITDKMHGKRGFVWLCDGLYSKQKKMILKKLTVAESYVASFKTVSQRVYPQNRIAGQILGYTNNGGKGVSGLEKKFDHNLEGQPGYEYIFRDAKNNISYGDTFKKRAAIPGENLVLTINSKFQNICENEIKNSVKKWKAKKGSVVLVNPNNGEILAMASYPDYNPNIPGQFNAYARKNKAVTDAYEPGSTFKSITAAVLFEENLIKESDVFYCNNKGYKILKNKAPIKDSHKHENEFLTFSQVISKSSNIGIVKASERLDSKIYYSYLRSFGFGDKTDIQITGEARGIVPKHSKWNKLTMPNISFGQGISVTPLQLAMAYSTIANGGKLYRPLLVKGIIDNDGQVLQNNKAIYKRNVISAKSAKRVRNLLKNVVRSGGTAENVFSEIVDIAGKTGTSQKVVNGRYSKREHDGSFVGFFPADKPKYVCVVMLDNPKPYYWGGTVAGPVFKHIAEKITIIDNKNQEFANKIEIKKRVVPAVKGLNLGQTKELCENLNIKLKIIGNGKLVKAQDPKPFSLINTDSILKIYFDDQKSIQFVPDVTQKTLREAIKELHHLNIDIEIKGSGIVTSQSLSLGLIKNKMPVCTLYCKNLVNEKSIKNSFFADLK